MGIALISNGDTGLGIRGKLNRLLGMFTENKYTGTVAPSVTDDSAANFEVGSKWFNALTGIEYICQDATAGAAVWVRQDNADFFGYVAGRYYHGINALVVAGTNISGNSLRMHPIIIKERMSLSELGVRVTTVESAKSFQLAIYAADAATKLPTGNALGVTSSMSAGTTGAMTAALSGGSIMLSPGLYWMAINTDSTTAIFQAFGSNSTFIAALLGGENAGQVASGTATSISYLAFIQTFGTWPDLTGQTFARGNSSAYAGVFFKVA